MAKKFKKHMMYGDGKSKMAKTKQEHLDLKNKGWGHTKPTSPLKINQALIQNYKGVNKYTSKGGGTRIPEMNVDPIFQQAAKTAVGGVREGFIKPPPKQKEEKNQQSQQQNTNESSKRNNEQVDSIERKSTKKLPVDNNALETQGKTTQPSLDTQKDPEAEANKGYEVNEPNKLTRNQEKLAGNAKPTRLRVRSVYNKGKRNDNMVRVNGQEMSVNEYNDAYGSATRRGSGETNSSYPTGDYDFSGSIDSNMPESSPNKYSPFKYFSKRFTKNKKTPFYFKQQPLASAQDPIVDMQMMNPNIEQDVDTYIANSTVIGDEKLDVLGSQANSRVYEYAKELKNNAASMVEQDNKSSAVNNSINTLRGLTKKVNNLVDKKAEWIENNGGGESTKRNFSQGSSGKNKFMQNAIFTERNDLFQMILPLPEVGVSGDEQFEDIKFSFGNAVVNSGDIFTNVFVKPENKFADFRKQAVRTAGNAQQRKPFNDYHADVAVDSLLDSKQNLLSFAWDDFAGPSFVEQYTDAYPEEDPTWMDVDSVSFDENKLHDEVSFWLKQKLKKEHQMASVNQSIDTLESLTPKQLIAKYSK